MKHPGYAQNRKPVEIVRFLQLSFGHAETETVPVRISHRKLTQSPRLIIWGGMDGRLRTLCRIQSPSAKGQVALINIVHKHTVDGAEDTVSRMTSDPTPVCHAACGRGVRYSYCTPRRCLDFVQDHGMGLAKCGNALRSSE